MNTLNKCLLCSKKYHCCINPPSKGYVTVYIDEARKIKNKTGLNYNEFLTFKKLPEKLADESKADFKGTEARLRASIMINNRILRLKTKKNNECVFLNKKKQCIIYRIRPTICRMYPFWFKNEKGKIKIVIHSGCEYCGLIDNKLTKKQLNQLKRTAKKIEKQTEHYNKNIVDFVKKNKII